MTPQEQNGENGRPPGSALKGAFDQTGRARRFGISRHGDGENEEGQDPEKRVRDKGRALRQLARQKERDAQR